MRIVHDAIAGTLESSDVMVKVSPPPGEQDELEVLVSSSVMAQFGHQIRAVVDDVLRGMDVTAGRVVVDDKGALDWAIRARLQAALVRGCDAGLDWSVLDGREGRDGREGATA